MQQLVHRTDSESILNDKAELVKGPLHNDVVQQEILASLPVIGAIVFGQLVSQPFVTILIPSTVYSLV